MRKRIVFPGVLLCAALTCLPSFSQESYEARAARLQAQDISPLIEKAERGDLPSQVLLWLAYSGGHGVSKDIQKGIPWLRKAAEQGSVESQWVLSTIYQFGRGGVPVDLAESFKWALKAAQHDHMVAQHNVGGAYLHGLGVEKNLEQARYWFGRAADLGFAHSEWMMGRIYLEGIGVTPDRNEALKWLTKSLAQGHAPTMITLAQMYSGPDRIPTDPQLVFDLDRAAAERGSHYAEFEVGRLYRAGYLNPPDYSQAMTWFNRAAAAGYAPADQFLGAMYEAGEGVPVDFAQARTHYERAADLGVSAAIQRMGELYRDGRGVPADPVTASMWFIIGSRMGAAESRNSLETIKAKCTAEQRQMAEAQANTWIAGHDRAMQQKPGEFEFQDWTWVERGPQPSRGPSTAEERAYAILLTQHIEKDPLSLDASAARAWLDKWWEEVPDLTVRPCNLVDAPNHEPYLYGSELYSQITYAQGVFILQNPAKTTDWNAAFLAGIEGALRAYESILKQKPDVRSEFMDELLQQRAAGNLGATLRELVQERCK